MVQRKQFWQALVLCAGLSSGVVLAQDDLLAAQKAVRMRQFDKAHTLYQNVAQSGNSEAQYQLAMLYLHGRGTKKDPAKALQWLEKAAESNHAGAQYLLSQQIKADNPERAHSLLQAAATQGYAAAQRLLDQQDGGPSTRTQTETPLQDQWFGAARNNDVKTLKQLREQGVELGITNGAGRTALFTAVVAGADNAVEWLLKEGVDVNHRDQFGLSAAQTAIERNQPELLQRLMKAGADPKQTLSNGDNLLHYAVRLQQPESVRLLLQQGVAINQRNKEGWTPLDLAEYKEADKLVALLKSKGGQNGQNWREGRTGVDAEALADQLQNQGELPAVARALINSNEKLLKTLLKQDPNRLHTVLPDGSTLLVLAVKQNKPEMVDLLLTEGAAVNEPAYRGLTALQAATRLERETMLERLLKAGADPLQRDESGKDSVHAAIEVENSALASALLEQVLADSASKPPVDEYLLLATQHHMDEAIELLLPYAGRTKAVDELGRNALWFAAYEKNAPLVNKLLAAGVSAKERDKLGRTPFLIAAERSCLECAKALLAGNDVNQQTESGNTALIVAAQNKDAALVNWLLQNKANVEVRNQRGNTAIMEAVNANAMDVVKLLIKADANVSRKNKLGFSAIDLARQVSPEMLELVKSKSVFGLF